MCGHRRGVEHIVPQAGRDADHLEGCARCRARARRIWIWRPIGSASPNSLRASGSLTMASDAARGLATSSRARELAAAQHREPQRLEVIRADDHEDRIAPCRSPTRASRPSVIVAKGHRRRDARRVPRQAARAADRASRGTVARPRQLVVAGHAGVDADDQLSIEREAGIGARDIQRATHEEAAGGDERKRDGELADDQHRAADETRRRPLTRRRACLPSRSGTSSAREAAHAGPSAKKTVLNTANAPAAANTRASGAGSMTTAMREHARHRRREQRSSSTTRGSARAAAPAAESTRPSVSSCRTIRAASAAERQADRDFLPPGRAAREQQVGEVQAGDAQHERGHQEQHPRHHRQRVVAICGFVLDPSTLQRGEREMCGRDRCSGYAACQPCRQSGRGAAPPPPATDPASAVRRRSARRSGGRQSRGPAA